MKARVQKWGHSLAVRIPKSFAEDLGWADNSPVEMAPEAGTLVIKTDKEQAWDLEELLTGVTDANIHPAWEAGSAAAFIEDENRESEPDPGDGKRGR
jgi:antitoxin MazE